MPIEKWVTLFILLAPLLILAGDIVVYVNYGPEKTITGVIRAWSVSSRMPEFVYVVGAVGLYLHLFREWKW